VRCRCEFCSCDFLTASVEPSWAVQSRKYIYAPTRVLHRLVRMVNIPEPDTVLIWEELQMYASTLVYFLLHWCTQLCFTCSYLLTMLLWCSIDICKVPDALHCLFNWTTSIMIWFMLLMYFNLYGDFLLIILQFLQAMWWEDVVNALATALTLLCLFHTRCAKWNQRNNSWHHVRFMIDLLPASFPVLTSHTQDDRIAL